MCAPIIPPALFTLTPTSCWVWVIVCVCVFFSACAATHLLGSKIQTWPGLCADVDLHICHADKVHHVLVISLYVQFSRHRQNTPRLGQRSYTQQQHWTICNRPKLPKMEVDEHLKAQLLVSGAAAFVLRDCKEHFLEEDKIWHPNCNDNNYKEHSPKYSCWVMVWLMKGFDHG